MTGGDDMDLTSANPGAFLQGEEGSALMDQEMEFDDDNMDMTDVLRRRSLGGRQPFGPVRSRDTIVFPSDDAIPSDDDDNTQDRSVFEGDSQAQSEVEQSREEIEYTVPMGRSLRRPPTEDPMWLALRQVTHSGGTPHEPEPSSEDDIQIPASQQGMDLNDAMARLMRARDSLGGTTEGMTQDMDITTANNDFAVQEDSFLSTDSIDDDIDQGNVTLNVSRVVGRMSLGGDARMSLGYQDSTMDESGIYGSAIPPSLTPRPSFIPPPTIQEESQVPDHIEAPRPTVFQPPPKETRVSPPQSTSPVVAEPPPKPPVFTFVPPPLVLEGPGATKSPVKPTSPIKPKPKPKFSAAFAPPVAKPSPKKPTSSSTPAHGTPNKRPFSVMQDGAPDAGRPSPAKRPAFDPKPIEGTAAGTPRRGRTSSQPQLSLSPSKTATSNASNGQPAPAKRQSGYFARRKSLGNALIPPQGNRREESSTPIPASPAKKGNGSRASLGATPLAPFNSKTTTAEVPTIVFPAEDTPDESAAEAVAQPISNSSSVQASPVPPSLTSAAPPFMRTPSPQPETVHESLPEDSTEEAVEAEQPETQAAEDIVSFCFRQRYVIF